MYGTEINNVFRGDGTLKAIPLITSSLISAGKIQRTKFRAVSWKEKKKPAV